METPTSTRELVGNEREEARETRRFDREGDESAGTAETRRDETAAADTRDTDTDTRETARGETRRGLLT